MLPAIFLSFLLFTPSSPAKNVNFPESKGLYRGFVRSLRSHSPYGYKVVTSPEPVRSGNVAERFELRHGDCSGVAIWNDCTTDRERSELMQTNPYIHQDKDYWFAWSIFVPSSYQNIYPIKVALGQFPQEGTAKPPLMFQNGRGGYWSDLNQLGKEPVLLIPEAELRERWHDLLVNVKWTRKKSGFLRIWVDGKKKVDYQGATVTAKGDIYFKYGIYRAFLSRNPKGREIPAQVVYFDEVKWGTSREAVEVKEASLPQAGTPPVPRKKSRMGKAISGITSSKLSPR